jgi:hypothetical protein
MVVAGQIVQSILQAGDVSDGMVGGNAFEVEAPGIAFLNDGLIRSGGGLGGLGGQGGAGSETVMVTQGWYYTPGSYYAIPDGYGNIVYRWAGAFVSQYSGIYTYYRNGSSNQIKRTYNSTSATTGGLPGDPGRGQGHDGVNLLGSSGAAGGTNAGAGGQGGDGGTFGVSGADGAAGTDGNNGSGVAGSPGSLAGFAIANFANVTLTGSGSILGRT